MWSGLSLWFWPAFLWWLMMLSQMCFYVSGHFYIFREMAIQFLCPFLKLFSFSFSIFFFFFWSFYMSRKSSLLILNIILIRQAICKCFLPFWGLPIHFLDGIICSTEVIFDEVQFINFLFCHLCFLVPKKSLPNPRSWIYFFVFFQEFYSFTSSI